MKTQFFFSTLCTISLCLTACGNDSKPQETTNNTDKVIETTEKKQMDTISLDTLPADAPVYTVSTMTSFEPFCFRDEFGNSTGFDIDVITAIGSEMGFRINYNRGLWSKMLPSLDDGSADIVASSVTITPERQEKYSFTNPYIKSKFAFAVSNSLRDKSLADITKSATIKYSMLPNTTANKILQNDFGVNDSQILTTDTQFLAIKKVLDGSVDATFEDEAMLHYYGKSFNGLNIIEYDHENIELGFVIAKDNTELLGILNQGLERIQKNGTYDKIYSKWFENK